VIQLQQLTSKKIRSTIAKRDKSDITNAVAEKFPFLDHEAAESNN